VSEALTRSGSTVPGRLRWLLCELLWKGGDGCPPN